MPLPQILYNFCDKTTQNIIHKKGCLFWVGGISQNNEDIMRAPLGETIP